MKELEGLYGSAKIFTDLVEEKAIEQIKTLLNQGFIRGSKVRIMPDVHAGAGCTIGTTMTIKDKVCPNLVGVDIGCGMLTVTLHEKEIDLAKLDSVIRQYVPSGFNIHDTPHEWADIVELEDLICRDHVDIERAKRSLGTLGGGNHFIEVDRDDDGNLYLVIHSGSRHLGLEVAGHYQRLAEKQIHDHYKDCVRREIAIMKAAGRQSEISNEIKYIKSLFTDVPKDLSYVSGTLFEDYIHDMKVVQRYAKYNRLFMADTILKHADLNFVRHFETVHNYIDTDAMILRKGAVSARAGQLLLIPINMRDGSLLCYGKGNADWNYSAPHGAGRLMSRSEAKKKFSVDEFTKSMEGIYTTSVGGETLDECPMAYKPIDSIIDNIGDTVDVCKIIRPIYNFKAGEK